MPVQPKLALVGAGAGLALLLTGCGVSVSASSTADRHSGSSTSGPSTPGVPGSPTPAPKSTTAPTQGGTTAIASITLSSQDANGNDGGSQTIAILQVVNPAQPDAPYDAAAHGKKLVAVKLRVLNSGRAVIDDAVNNCAKLVDSQGQAFTPSYSSISEGQSIDDFKLSSGQSETGYVVYEVPANAVPAKIQYTTDSGYGQAGTLQLR
jgi:hypothetical protein